MKATITALFAACSLALAAHAQTPALPDIPTNRFNVVQFGAVGDGRTLNTAAIQQAIAAAGANGGTVLFPAGNYVTGPLTLTNRLNLHLAKGAVLLISDDLKTYPLTAKRYQDCIYASDAHDLAITGEGIIDGQGQAWWTALEEDSEMVHRPFLVKLFNCTRVLVEGVTLRNSPMFHLVPQECTDVTLRHVTIRSPANTHNTDGIDPSGWNFLITGCTIDAGDDNIAIKPGGGRSPGNKNFLITDCTFLHGHGMSVGSSTRHGLEDLTVSNCVFDGTTAGIRIKTGRGTGGRLRHLTYEKLTMTNVKNVISIIDFYPERTAPKDPASEQPQPVTDRTPFTGDIVIRDVTASHCQNLGTIRGLPEAPVTDVTLANVQLSAGTGLKVYHARNIRFSQSKVASETGAALTTYDADVAGLK
jgi:polygalacturonase